MSEKLATTTLTTQLSNQDGRAIVSTRGQHIIVDSPPPLGGPNEELNPLDMLLAALATCGTFVIETAAREMDFPLEKIKLDIEADFNPEAVKGVDGLDPRIQEFRVNIFLSGVNEEQSEHLISQFKKRCPVYTTLSRASPIIFETILT